VCVCVNETCSLPSGMISRDLNKPSFGQECFSCVPSADPVVGIGVKKTASLYVLRFLV
jgi:hypothetical protein